MIDRTFTFEYVRPPHPATRFDSTLLHADARLIVLRHEVRPRRPLLVWDDEVIAPGFSAVWFLYKGERWDVGRFHRPDGSCTGYYVDALEPVRWRDGDPRTLDPLVDLFMDLWISLDGRAEILDEDDLAEAVESGTVSAEQAASARVTIESLARDVARGSFPPDEVRTWAA